jgi:hypothetical protein
VEARAPFTKFPTPLGEGYRVGSTIYLYTKRPIVQPRGHVRRALSLPEQPNLRDWTASMREWTDENNLPAPRDKEGLYNYVLTLGEAEAPTIWPTRTYMRTHRTLSTKTMQHYVPTVVYPTGTATMCRFGHQKTVRNVNGKGKRGGAVCNKCAWWRHQGVDLSVYKPTHCLKGHTLKNNRWLHHRKDRRGVTEYCVKCNNDEVMNKTGYQPSN